MIFETCFLSSIITGSVRSPNRALANRGIYDPYSIFSFGIPYPVTEVLPISGVNAEEPGRIHLNQILGELRNINNVRDHVFG